MKRLIRKIKEETKRKLFRGINKKRKNGRGFKGAFGVGDDYIDSYSVVTIEDFLPIPSECNSTPIEMVKHLEDQILGEKCFDPSSPVISWLENVKEIIERYIRMTENFDQWPQTWEDYL